jgi:Luciferase-like monooxygenase
MTLAASYRAAATAVSIGNYSDQQWSDGPRAIAATFVAKRPQQEGIDALAVTTASSNAPVRPQFCSAKGQGRNSTSAKNRKAAIMLPLSILDLAPVAQGASPAIALQNARDLAQHAERWGYRRYWVAEHHNMVGIASAATSVVIGFIAANTSTIRVGAGGIMLPNHSPLVVAEQFGTLESLYPKRIDLGLGRDGV